MARKVAERAEALVEQWGEQVDAAEAADAADGGSAGGGDGCIEVEINEATQAVTMEVMHEIRRRKLQPVESRVDSVWCLATAI